MTKNTFEEKQEAFKKNLCKLLKKTEPAVFAVSIAEVIFEYALQQKNPERAINIITDNIIYMKIDKMITENLTDLNQDKNE